MNRKGIFGLTFLLLSSILSAALWTQIGNSAWTVYDINMKYAHSDWTDSSCESWALNNISAPWQTYFMPYLNALGDVYNYSEYWMSTAKWAHNKLDSYGTSDCFLRMETGYEWTFGTGVGQYSAVWVYNEYTWQPSGKWYLNFSVYYTLAPFNGSGYTLICQSQHEVEWNSTAGYSFPRHWLDIEVVADFAENGTWAKVTNYTQTTGGGSISSTEKVLTLDNWGAYNAIDTEETTVVKAWNGSIIGNSHIIFDNLHTVLICGDNNGDRCVDIYDSIRQAGAYGKSYNGTADPPDAAYFDWAYHHFDYNRDGSIDMYDSLILASQMGAELE